MRKNMSPARKSPDTSTYSGRFAVRLRSLREKAGLTVPQLAELVGAKMNTVYSWEQGSRSPNMEDLPIIAEALELKNVRSLIPLK